LVESCIHAANLLYLGSFLARDILWLRVLTCAGLVLGVVFFTCQPSPMYGPTIWHVVFLGINGVQIWRLVGERRQLALTAEQERVARAAFEHLSRDELLVLLTRSMHEDPTRLDPARAADRPLTPEEKALRDIAFSRLSRAELLNLLTRRMWAAWAAVGRLKPRRWRRQAAGGRPTEPGASATG
jgi:hypothetical protein